MSDLDAITINELAAQLTKVAGRSVDATVLGRELEECAVRYGFCRFCSELPVRWSESRKTLKQALTYASKLRAALETLATPKHHGVTFVIADAYAAIPEVAEELTERQKDQVVDEFGVLEPVTPPDVVARVSRAARSFEA